jgi:MSHA biogenesis protein MshO
MLRSPKYMDGFTLIEAIMVMVITGILVAVVASFASPLKGYFAATARADLVDVADTALRRMGRELHAALPNSVRVSGNYIEFLPTTMGGRYRKEQDCTAACTGDALSFSVADTSFDVIGSLSRAPVIGEEVVIYNTAPYYVYVGNNVAAIAAGSTANNVVFTARQFPLESPGKRFQIIGQPVTYACSGTTLWRYSGYSRQAAQPNSIDILDALTGVVKARLATGVNCAAGNFSYMPGATQRADLVTMSLTLSKSSDSVTLLHQVHVQNVP